MGLIVYSNCCRRAEHDLTMAKAKAEEQAATETALRREWAGKTKAAEWALKAHRDKQVGAVTGKHRH